jgi:NAD(P)-dependent dehydrogenase (short-subunit alcohol dehydrogenase family)
MRPDIIAGSVFPDYELYDHNAVAPGVVDTPLQQRGPKEVLRSLDPMGVLSSIKDIVDAVMYLTEAHTVTGEILNGDSGAHTGRW